MGKNKGHKKNQGNGKSGGSRGSKPKPSQAPPAKDGLNLTLNAGPEFLQAVRSTDCPAAGLKSGGEATGPLPLKLGSWSNVAKLLDWFKLGVVADTSAHLVFSSALTPENRAELHGLAGKLGLESVSQGVGNDRHIALYAEGSAPSTSKVELNEEQQEQRRLLYLLAKKKGVSASRDEIGEMVASGKLTHELQQIWQEDGADQVAVARLNNAASKGQLQELKEAIAAHPEVVERGLGDIQSLLTPLHCSAAQGYADCLQALLDAGAPLESVDGFGMTPLASARQFERQDTEALLLRAGAHDPQAKGEFSRAVPDPAASKAPALQEPSSERKAEKEASQPAPVKSETSDTRASGVPESGEKQAAQEPLPAKENEAPANEDKEQQGATTFGDEDQKPQYQDPRGTAHPSAPPTAAQPVGQPTDDTPGQQTELVTGQPEGKAAEAEEAEEGRQPYTEGSQPPSSAPVAISQVPAIVGGQLLPAEEGEEHQEPIMDAKTATYGEQQGPAATDVGKQVIAADPEPQQDSENAGDNLPVSSKGPSQPPANNYSSKPSISQQMAEDQAKGASQAGRPKGLGKSPGLPQKRPTTAKVNAKAPARKGPAERLEEAAERLPGVWESLKESAAACYTSLVGEGSQGQPSWYRQTANWLSDNKVLVAGGVAAAAVAVGGFSWLRSRR